MILEGHCHCRSVEAVFETAIDPDVIQVRACQCDFCRSRGARTVSDPNGSMTFRFKEGAVTSYRFASRSADFLLCATCGAYVGVVMQDADGPVGVLNAAGLGIEVLALRAPDVLHLENETPEDKRARRRARWSPVVLDIKGASA